jgi:hypothetical protein
MKTYLDASRDVGTPRGDEYAARLAAMPPDEAADEIFDMFALCLDEDLPLEIYNLVLNGPAADRIALAVCRKRWAHHEPPDVAEVVSDMLRECEGDADTAAGMLDDAVMELDFDHPFAADEIIGPKLRLQVAALREAVQLLHAKAAAHADR